ncbi:MAG: hypothetical protein CBC09_01515 [Cellvibrionales bacterium TMED49]|nr:hypothetical protein [Porticoccaceae bacterium]OUU39797.1 MAG: hypothetical protein CBC09_01515 [Cellvibrionales bacterium TMED49]
MVHDGDVINELIDILQYNKGLLTDMPLHPKDKDRRYLLAEGMDIATNDHNSIVKTYVYAMAFARPHSKDDLMRYRDLPDDEELFKFHERASSGFLGDHVARAEVQLFEVYDCLEDELADHNWIVGDTFTDADMTRLVQFFLMTRNRIISFARYPNLERWRKRFMARPLFRRRILDSQPWYALMVCLALVYKAFFTRGSFPTRRSQICMMVL